VTNDDSQLIKVTIFCLESAWNHIKHEREGKAATIFHHMIVCPGAVTKTSEEEPGK
jgi:hypothetical protein